MKASALLALALLTACAPKVEDAALQRRRLTPAAQSGWVRLPLDGVAQRAKASLWLGNGEGQPVAFLWAEDGLWRPRTLTLDRVLLGKDSQGRPSAEFTLPLPERLRGAAPEQLTLQFQWRSGPPWVAAAEVWRRREGGSMLALDLEPKPVLYDFGGSGSRSSLTIPWDAQSYRVLLTPVSGPAPALQGVTAQACVRWLETEGGETLTPRKEALPGTPGQRWRLSLAAPERVVGLEVLLEPPAAPLAPVLKVDGATLAVQGLVWNLPALGSEATRIALTPVSAAAMELELPAGARLRDAKVLVRNQVLLFPAERGGAYFLHSGGRVKGAAGTLTMLPDTGREVFGQAPLALGAAEPDPQGLPALEAPGTRTRSWLPWVAGLVMVLLGGVAYRLFKDVRE